MKPLAKPILMILLFALCMSQVSAHAWWDTNYAYRQQLNITTQEIIPAGYTITIEVNATDLVNSGKSLSNISDLRIVYFNGTNNDIDRINITSISERTKIQFQIQNEITSNSSNYFIYYGNNNPDIVKENKSNVYYLFEDFEDQSHPFSNGLLSPTMNTGSKKNGNYGLEGDGVAGYRRAAVPEYLQRGYRIEGWVYSGYAGDNADLPGLGFGIQTTERNGYQVVLDWRSGTGGSSDFQIRKDYQSGNPIATSTAATVTADTWYYINASWEANGRINATIYDDSMNQLTTMTATDSTYTTGYYGVVAYRDGFWDDVAIKLLLNNAPTIQYLTEQNSGPLISNVNVDKAIIQVGEYTNISATITSGEGINNAWVNITSSSGTQKYSMNNSGNIYYYNYNTNTLGVHSIIIYANDTINMQNNNTELSVEVYGHYTLNDSAINTLNPNLGSPTIIQCSVIDVNTSMPVENANVTFYSNESGIISSVLTDNTGVSSVEYYDITIGIETVGCNITDDQNIYYNVTGTNNFEYEINTSEPEEISVVYVSLNNTLRGVGQKILINTSLTSPTAIDTVLAEITYPNSQKQNHTMNSLGNNLYSFEFNQTYQTGTYAVTIYANNTGEEKTNSLDRYRSFNITGSTNITIEIDKTIYGADATIEMASAKANWWDSNFIYRKKVTIENNDVSDLQENYTARITLNTQSLISASKLSGNCKDLRIVHEGNSIDWTNTSACNTVSTIIEFKIRENITNNDTYYVYYGYDSASSPPQNKSNVYAFYEDFESYTTNTNVGNGWISDPENSQSDWRIIDDGGNKVLRDDTIDGDYHRIWNGENWQNYEISARMKLDSFLFSGIGFRRQPWSGSYFDHYMLIGDDRNNDNLLALRIWNGGGSSWTALQTDVTSYEGLDWQTYTLSIEDNNVNLQRGSATLIRDVSLDATNYQTGGYVGLMSYSGNTMFDDIIVRLIADTDPSYTLDNEEEYSLDSSIINNGEKPLSAYLQIKVQYYNDSWTDYETVYSPQNTSDKIILSPEGSLSLTQVYNNYGKFNTTNKPDGTYRIIAYVSDYQGNIILNTIGTQMLKVTNFEVSTTAPIISLETRDYSGKNNFSVTLEYNVTDTTNIDNCKLYVDDELKATDYTVTKDITQTIYYEASSVGSKEWYLTCTDDEGNTGISNTRNIVIIPSYRYGGNTTNFEDIDLRAVQGLIIENPGIGNINFTSEIDLSNGGNVNAHVQIEENSVTIDTSNFNALNNPARITLYSSYQYPAVFRDGSYCNDCQIIQSTPNLIFAVPHFTTYTVSENSILTISSNSETIRKYTNDNITFYANYSNTTSNQPIIGTCTIYLESGSSVMTYNAGIYEHNITASSSGTYEYNVSCSASGFATLNITDYYNVNSLTSSVIAPTNISINKTTRANITYGDQNIGVESGNTSQLTINSTKITDYWQGYYGNLEANIKLVNSQNYSFYEWNDITPTGEVFATRNVNTNFDTIKCALDAEIIAEEEYTGNTNSTDSILNTFNQNNHPEINVQTTSITANSCYSTVTNGNSHYELILSDGASNIIYTSIINQSTGFDGNTTDFQMLVSADGTETYYFFVEIG